MILIACPQSRNGRARRWWPYWLDRLATAGVDARLIQTEYPGHATEIVAASEETVVAVGGDGTISEVLCGVLQGGKSVKMGVLYAGTSPDFCAFHGIPTKPDLAVETLIAARSKRVDLLRLAYHDAEGNPASAHCGCSCNVGFGGRVARFANRYRRFLGDTPGTMLGVLKAIALSSPADVTVEIDGRMQHLSRCNHLVLMKNPYIASGLRLDLPLANDDGRAFAVAVMGQGRIGLCLRLPGFYTGKIVHRTDVFLEPFSHVRVTAAKPVEVEFDGDPRGFLPVEAELVSRCLDLIGATDA
jgi:diacylglycerol kinase family enzyme